MKTDTPGGGGGGAERETDTHRGQKDSLRNKDHVTERRKRNGEGGGGANRIKLDSNKLYANKQNNP